MTDEQLEYTENLLASKLEAFRTKMKEVADEVMSEVYTDVLPYIVSDTEANIGSRVQSCIENILRGNFTDVGGHPDLLQIPDGCGCNHYVSLASYNRVAGPIYKAHKDVIENSYIKELESKLEYMQEELNRAWRR